MTPLQMELHSARQARLVRMGAWHRNVPIVPSDRVRPRPVETPVKAIEFKPEPAPLPVSQPAPVANPDPIKIETWFRVMEEGPRKLRVEHIQRAVALHYGVDRDDILSHRRTAKVMKPRQVAAYLCKRLTAKSLPEIGRKFGGRDHTTIMHSVRRVEILMGEDPDLAEEIISLETRLRKLLPAQCPTCGADKCEAA